MTAEGDELSRLTRIGVGLQVDSNARATTFAFRCMCESRRPSADVPDQR